MAVGHATPILLHFNRCALYSAYFRFWRFFVGLSSLDYMDLQDIFVPSFRRGAHILHMHLDR